MCSRGEESVRFGDLRNVSLLFVDEALLASLDCDLQQALRWFLVECDAVEMRVGMSKAMVLCKKNMDCFLHIGSELLPQVKEFKYIGVLFTSEGKMEIDRQIGAAY